jgi:hypothetical protein
LQEEWDRHRKAAEDAGWVVLAGPGRFGHRLLAVNRATETLARWSTRWQPYLADMPTSTASIARYATWPPNQHRITEAFDAHARAQAERAHPERPGVDRAAEDAEQRSREAWREVDRVRDRYGDRLIHYGGLGYADDLDERLEHADQQISDSKNSLHHVSRRLNRLSGEPVVAQQEPGWLDAEHEAWQAQHAAETAAERQLAKVGSALAIDAAVRERMYGFEHEHHTMQHDMEQHGPSFGR